MKRAPLLRSVTATWLLWLALLALACGGTKPESAEDISDSAAQDSIFSNLVKVTQNSIPEQELGDSLAFLILPVHATCPYCRKKTIDSISSHERDLPGQHYIIISANGGRKAISSFFKEQDKELPDMENQLFLDSNNLAFRYNLFDDKPTMYYTFNRKAYQKVASLPATVKEDLNHFFSGDYHPQKALAGK